MSYGKQSGSSGSTPVPTELQKQYVANQAGLGTQAMGNLSGAASALPGLYNTTASGVNQAATNLAGYGNSLQQNTGGTGQTGYATGMNALQNITSPAYQQAEMNAAMIPAQLQYQQNLAQQNTGFGGAGQLGSARSALANQQLAGLTQLQQQQAAAGVMNNIANQQLAAGQALTGAGLSGAQLGLTGGQAGLTAAQTPFSTMQQYLNLNNQLAGYGTPSWNGLIGTSGTSGSTSSGVSI